MTLPPAARAIRPSASRHRAAWRSIAVALVAATAGAVLAPPAPVQAAPLAIGAGSYLLQPATRTAGTRARATAGRAANATRVTAATTPRGEAALAADLGAMLTSNTRNGEWGALVVSLATGDTLFAHRPDAPMTPASTMKLFTSALAFERLGPEFSFSTDVLRDGPLGPDGTVHGNLILRGDGDPSLSPKFIRGGPGAAMELLAEFVAGAGVTHVAGDLVADATAMEARRIPEGWLDRYAGAAYAAPFSALSLNENTVIVDVRPSEDGRRAVVQLEPATTTLRVESDARLVSGRRQKLRIYRTDDDVVRVTGTIGSRAKPHRVLVVVGDPARYTAGAFRAALEARGITVDGDIRLGATPEESRLVTSLPSPPLARLVSKMNRESNNHFAEQLFRAAARGATRTGPGNARYANALLQEYAGGYLGVAADAVTATDGSGLSVLDRVTPRALVHLLDYADRADWGPLFHGTLPVAGETETLKRRMRRTPAAGNLHAKTGTTNEVISLAGYVTAENGETLAFAFLYNGKDRWRARETIDAMGPTLAGWRR